MKKLITPFILINLLFVCLPGPSLAAVDISNIEVKFLDQDSVQISWLTNEASQGKLLFGKSRESLPYFVIDGKGSVRYHQIEIGALDPDTKYYYQIAAQTAAGTVYSFIYDFETEDFNDNRAPRVSEAKVAWVSATAATISWQTDEPATGYLEYGKTEAYGFRAGGTRNVTEHYITLRNLSPNQNYYIRFEAIDEDGNSTGWYRYQFRTRSNEQVDQADLKVENFRPTGPDDSQITNTSITISFDTNHYAKGNVQLDGAGIGRLNLPLDYGTKHEVSFSGLEPESNYVLRIWLDDVLGKRYSETREIRTKLRSTGGSGGSTSGGSVNGAAKRTSLTCSADIYRGLGYYGQYYVQEEDLRYPLNMQALETGYFASNKLELTQIDGNLKFGRNFAGRGVMPGGSPYHFSSYWRALVAVPRDGYYTYKMSSDDNSWVLINGQPDASIDGKQGMLNPDRSVYLQRGLHTFEIYYTFRGRTGSEFTFDIDSGVRVFPLPSGCSAEEAIKYIPNGNFDALFSIYNPHPDAVGSSGSGGVAVGSSGTNQGGYVGVGVNGTGGGIVVNGSGEVDVLGASYSHYTPATALYRIEGTPDIYALMNGQLHYISSPASFREYGYDWNDIVTVNAEIFNQYPRARLIKSPDSNTIYFLYQRPENQWLKIALNSPTVFVSYPQNYWGNVITVNNIDVASYPDVKLIKTAGNNSVYYLDTEKQTKHPVSAGVFKAKGFNPHEIAVINQVHLDSYLTADPLK